MRCSLVLCCVVLFTTTTTTAKRSEEHAFSTITNMLTEISDHIKVEDSRDRNETNWQIGKLAETEDGFVVKVDQLTDHSVNQEKERKFLLGKLRALPVLKDALELQQQFLSQERSRIEQECSVGVKLELLAHNAAESTADAISSIANNLENIPESELMEGSSVSTAVSTAESHVTLIREGGSGVVKHQDRCRQQLDRVDGLIAQTTSKINELARNATDFEASVDEKRRTLLAIEPLLTAAKTSLTQVQSSIEVIANSYQQRRNSRITQLCETASLHSMTRESESEVFATLPGPAKHSKATIDAVDDNLVNCQTPMHKLAQPGETLVPRGHGPLSLNGRQPLPDAMADLTPPDCGEPKIVDVDA